VAIFGSGSIDVAAVDVTTSAFRPSGAVDLRTSVCDLEAAPVEMRLTQFSDYWHAFRSVLAPTQSWSLASNPENLALNSMYPESHCGTSNWSLAPVPPLPTTSRIGPVELVPMTSAPSRASIVSVVSMVVSGAGVPLRMRAFADMER
jgi:hypothetical protein